MSKRHFHADPSARHAHFTETPSRPPLPWTAIVIAASIVFLALAILMVGRVPGGAAPTVVEAARVDRSSSADLVVPASTLDDGAAHFYAYTTTAGRPVRFFVMKSRDGVVRAALDACTVCYADKRGYRQSGDAMLCNKCGKSFPSTAINDVTGGCNPVPLDRTVEGDRIVVAAAGLERGAVYF